jgi:hypothetical protein
MGCEGERTIVPARGWALGEWCEPRSYCCICDISLCHVAVGCTHHHIGATVLKLLGFSAVAQASEALLLTAPAEHALDQSGRRRADINALSNVTHSND